MDDNILSELIEICKSIKELKLVISTVNNNYGFVKLIETQKKLFNISLENYYNNDETFCKEIENSLIKHANTIKYFKTTKIITKIPSSFVNLRVLELNDNFLPVTWNLENISLPYLQVLNVNGNNLISLIES